MKLINILLLVLISKSAFSQILPIKIPADQETIFHMGDTNTSYLPSKNLKVFVWNIYKGKKKAFKSEFLSTMNKFDLGMLQEFYFNNKQENLFLKFPYYNTSFATSFKYPIIGTRTGVATMAKSTPLTESFNRTEDRDNFLLTKTPKMALSQTYLLDNQSKLLVINIHSLNNANIAAYKRQLFSFSEDIKAHTGPIILAGDFNSWKGKKIKFLKKFVKDHDLKEVTFKEDNRVTPRNAIIDYIFYKRLKIIQSDTYKGLKGSDHTAMSAVFSVY